MKLWLILYLVNWQARKHHNAKYKSITYIAKHELFLFQNLKVESRLRLVNAFPMMIAKMTTNAMARVGFNMILHFWHNFFRLLILKIVRE